MSLKNPFPESPIASEVCAYEDLLLASRLDLPGNRVVAAAKAGVAGARVSLLKTLVQLEQDALEFREIALEKEPPMPRRREAVMATRAKRAHDDYPTE